MIKRGLAISEISLLMLSLFAFCFIINLNFVKGGEDTNDDLTTRFNLKDESLFDLSYSSKKNPETHSATPAPTKPNTYQKIYDWVFKEGDAAPKGFEWDKSSKEYAKAASDAQGASGVGFSVSGIMQGAIWAGMVYGAINMIGGFFLDDDAKLNAFASASAAGVFAGKGVYSLIGKGGVWSDSKLSQWAGDKIPGGVKGLSAGTGIAVAALVFFATYEKTKTETVEFECNVWAPPEGGEHCDECNTQGLPCSEYQCRSLGQACELVNKGTDNEMCVWINRKDVEYPTIQPWEEVLTTDYKYSPDSSISPPDRGVKIIPLSGSNSGCVKAFTPLSFGVTTNEPAQCKLDYKRTETFEEMAYYFGGDNLFSYNHSQSMSLPGSANMKSENLTLKNNGNYELYIRCKDKNGNYNTANFVLRYCVDKGPDTTPPLIVTTDLLNNMPVAFNQSSAQVKVYVNEPAECKWSHLDKAYNEMENSMQCDSSVLEMNAQMLYECNTNLTGIKDREENLFYFRCKDQPSSSEEDRNTNTESYLFTIQGTQPLVLESVGPNNTIKDSTNTIKVTLTAKTSAGYKEGKAICYYKESSLSETNYVQFFNTNSHEHSQNLWLSEGTYNYDIKCQDLGGNTQERTIQFKVDSDNSAPNVVRAYNEANYLKIITNEEAECVYDTSNCNYPLEEGLLLSNEGYNSTEHYTEWNTNLIYYIKCKDSYDNQPSPDVCSIIARPLEL